MTPLSFNLFKVHDMTPAQIRRAGVFLVVAGLFIAAGGAALALLALDVPVPPEWLPAGTRVDPRTEEQRLTAAEFFGTMAFAFGLLLFGTTSLLQGIVQVASGRRNRLLLRVMFVLLASFLAAGVVAAAVLGRRFGTGDLNG